MAVKSGFYNSDNHDCLYSAEDFNEAYSLIIADGIDNSFGGKLKVSVDSGLTLNVASGKAYYIEKWIHNDAIYQVTLEEASALLPRIDAIVLDVNDTDEVRDADIIAVSGTPASTPVRPTLVNDTNHIQIPLAYVNVAAGATSLSSSDLTDVRGSGISTWTGAGIPKNNIALIENGATASQTLTKGAYIVHNNQFYIVTQTIAQGTAITEGVNIESRTVGDEISTINSNLSATLTFASNFSNISSMVSKKNGVVCCNFNFKRVSGSSKIETITTLPANFRPTQDVCFPISITDGSATLEAYLGAIFIYTNGQVIFYCPTSIGANMFFAGGTAFVIE